MKAKKIKYYLFNELSEKAKQKAINDFIKDQESDFPDQEISVFDIIEVFILNEILFLKTGKGVYNDNL